MRRKNIYIILFSFFILSVLLFFFLNLQRKDKIRSKNKNEMNTAIISPSLSHLHVKGFCQDSLGYMWIATARGLNRYNGYDYKQFFHNKEDDSSLDNDMIYSLFLDSQHRLWVGTSAGVNRYDFINDKFVRYKMPFAFIHTFYEDAEGYIWVGTSMGVGKVDQDKLSVEIFSNKLSGTVSTLLNDKIGKFWAGTDKGLAYYTQNSQWDIMPINGNRSVSCICMDPQGGFIIGTNTGIAFFDPYTNSFINSPQAISSNESLNTAYIHFIKEIEPLKYLIGTAANGLFLYDALRQTLEQNPVEYTEPLDSQQPMSCDVDNQGNVWIGSFDKGIGVYNTKHRFFNQDSKLSNTFKGIFTTRIIEDKYNNLWLGTRYKGLYRYAKDGDIKIYNSSNSRIFKDNNNLVEGLFIDSRDQLWIACADQIAACTFDKSGKLSVERIITQTGITGSASIAEDRNGNVWFGLSNGLFVVKGGEVDAHLDQVYTGNAPKVYLLSSGELIFSAYGKGVFRVNNNDLSITPLEMPSAGSTIIAQHCVDIFEDAQNRIWFGSYNEGTAYIKGKECRIFNMSDGLPCNDITCISADMEGNIWMSTAHGLSCVSPDFTIKNYFEYDGTLGDLYHEKSNLIGSDGKIYFTGNHGLTFFDPRMIMQNSTQAPIVIEDLKIHNESVRPGNKSSILDKNISFTDEIILNHKHSVITIDYSGIDFLTPQKLTYSFKLEGLDQQWNNVGNFRRATYSNLIPGNYTFVVTAVNSDGLTSVTPAKLKITVKPAPWATWWAWLIYIALFCGAIYLFMRLWTKIKLQKQSLEMKSYEREREQEVTEMKMTFFTNISHELRTPLTLISAPIQQLIGKIDHESTEGQLLQTVYNNCQRLYKLMDQLLDFRKMEDGVLALKVKQGNIIEELASIVDNYKSTASYKGISIQFLPHIPDLEMWYDIDKIDKIMNNLLSNAMKHTSSNGRIWITTYEFAFFEVQEKYKRIYSHDDRYIEISVLDDGPGVPPDKLDEIFLRYRQIESPIGLRLDYAGTGIGLHYTKRLVEHHHGEIIAEIPSEGGMKFSFILPLDDVYTISDKIQNQRKPDYTTEDYVTLSDSIDKDTKASPNTHRYTVLIAEDNIDLMMYFRQMLGEKYNIIEALDGEQAWETMQTEYPDIVLSDVIMPILSGYELCKRIKQHPVLSHIPVILLTAKTSMPEQLEGLSYGADAYICKPFNVNYLLLTIENRLKNRERLCMYYSTPQQELQADDMLTGLNTLDRQFMDKLTGLLDKELSNSNLNVDDIASEMAFSRTSFYRKLKGLTDMAPADFIRNYRLKRAAEMILEGSWILSEVSERTGFGNYTHFSVAFKKHFGVVPKNYKSSLSL